MRLLGLAVLIDKFKWVCQILKVDFKFFLFISDL